MALTHEQEKRKRDLIAEIQLLRDELADCEHDEDRSALVKAEAELKTLGFTLQGDN